jgi:hypothetical protein
MHVCVLSSSFTSFAGIRPSLSHFGLAHYRDKMSQNGPGFFSATKSGTPGESDASPFLRHKNSFQPATELPYNRDIRFQGSF